VAAVISTSPSHAQTDLRRALIRDRADVGWLAARVNADATPTICGHIKAKAAGLTFTPRPYAALRAAYNLRVQPLTGRNRTPQVADVRHRKRLDPGTAVTPIFARFPLTSEISVAAKASDDAATSFSNAIRVIVRTGPDFTSVES
jgi:hypothetical protein